MSIPDLISELTERFTKNKEDYLSLHYKEAQLRQEFINPLFKALGWDVYNEKGYAETYKDVCHEDSIKIGDAPKNPDYCFQIGGVRKFFVETKKPSVNIKENPEPAFQLRRYAWSAKLPLSILTNFQEFSIYDCRVKPTRHDKASKNRILYLTYQDYFEKWDEIAGIFSKEAVLKGDFDRYAKDTKSKSGTTEVDDEFLKEIEDWREELARNMALRNDRLSQRDLNYAVQLTIDRIIFLRMCEDRGLEAYGRLKALVSKENIYKEMMKDHFRLADERYNSGLFHFKKEKGRPETHDTLTPSLVVDDKVLKNIFSCLYYPDCPYEFSVLRADILGQVYERFLGKVIRLTAAHRAKVEEKPEVRKSGGVYYTPTYIVDYIVKNTVGKQLEEKEPSQIEKMRILDPACGSGSFLIAAYQYLLDWHRDWYIENNPSKWSKGKKATIVQISEKDWRLTPTERKRILLNNIYGVDIDSQAVEVTKLSLLLKVLEGVTGKNIWYQYELYSERALPDLSRNIKCGNSLIGPEFYTNGQISIFDEEAQYRLNTFDWKSEDGFREIMKDGGFNVILGNPPYIRIQTMKEWAPAEVDFYKKKYYSASKGNYDIYVVFLEKGLSLMNDTGVLGFILPHKFFTTKYGEPIRELISQGKHLMKIVHLGYQQVFAGATTYTCLLFLSKQEVENCEFIEVKDLTELQPEEESESQSNLEGYISNGHLKKNDWTFVVGKSKELFFNLNSIESKLENVTTRIFQGLKTSADKIFIVKNIEKKNNKVKVFSRQLSRELWLECDLLHPLYKGGDSKKYSLLPTKRLILFPYQSSEKGVFLIEKDTLSDKYPLTWQYLRENRTFLQKRERGKMKGANWYAYGRSQALEVITQPKLFTPDIALRSSFSYDKSGDVFFTGGVAGGYGILPAEGYLFEYLLGLLNSRLLEWFLQKYSTQMRGGYFSYEARFIKKLPIRDIDFNLPRDVANHDQLVYLVKQMLDLQEKLKYANTPYDKNRIQRQIHTTDIEIDRLVYALYDLTEKEIKIVDEQLQSYNT